MAFGVEVICHLGKITIIRKMAWLFFWQQRRKRTDFSAYKDKSLRNLKRFRGCCLTGKNISCEPLGSVENQTFFFFVKAKTTKEGKGKIKNKNGESKKYSFLLDFETEMITIVFSIAWSAPSTGPWKKRTYGVGRKVDFQWQELEDGFTRASLESYVCSHCK